MHNDGVLGDGGARTAGVVALRAFRGAERPLGCSRLLFNLHRPDPPQEKRKAECKRAPRAENNCGYDAKAAVLPRAFGLALIVFSRLAANSSVTAFCSFSVSTR